jgi:hypothetical protein
MKIYGLITVAALAHFALTEGLAACPSCKDAALSAGSQPLLLSYSASVLLMIAVPLIVLAALVLHIRSFSSP